MNKQKDDQGKLRWDLLPLDVVEKLVEIYEFGANKYEENSWRTIENGYKRCRAALFRHLTAYDKGERVDPESGKSHLAHAAWNALSMVYFAEKDQKVEHVIYPNIGQNVEFSYKYEGGVFNSVGTIEKYVLDKNGETFYVREESEQGRAFTYMLKREEIIKPI
jgi:hypothetical protein